MSKAWFYISTEKLWYRANCLLCSGLAELPTLNAHFTYTLIGYGNSRFFSPICVENICCDGFSRTGSLNKGLRKGAFATAPFSPKPTRSAFSEEFGLLTACRVRDIRSLLSECLIMGMGQNSLEIPPVWPYQAKMTCESMVRCNEKLCIIHPICLVRQRSVSS